MPIIICLLIEKGLSVVSFNDKFSNDCRLFLPFLKEIVAETAGRFAHVFNLVVLVMIPIVVIHFRGSSFGLSEKENFSYCFDCPKILFSFFFSWFDVSLLSLLNSLHEVVELRSREPLVSLKSKAAENFNLRKTSR